MKHLIQRRILFLLLIQTVVKCAFSQNITRPSKVGERDYFTNRNCDWTNCSKHSAACTTAECCQCTCDTGRTFMSLNNSCMAEKTITTGCNLMAQSSNTVPWSFMPISVVSANHLLTGLYMFRCTNSGCKRANVCEILQVMYENYGWKELPTKNESKLKVMNNLLMFTGEECNSREFQGLLLTLRIKCKVQNQNSQSSAETSCLVVKIAGNYQFGGIPTIGSHCDGNMTASIQATSTKHLPWSTLANAFDGITLITLLPPSTYQSNLVSPSVKTRKSEDRLISTTPINKKMMLAATKNPSEKLEKTANLLLLPSMYSVSNGIKTDSVLMTTKNPTTRMVPVAASPSITHSLEMLESTEFGGGSISVTTLPLPNNNQGKTGNHDDVHNKYLLVSSIIAGLAFLCIILLIIALMVLRRKKRKLQKQARAQGMSVDEQILKRRQFRSGLSPPHSPPPLPPILKLRSIQQNDTIYRNKLDRINLSNSWKSNQEVETDDEYDIPADPPGLPRSFSTLYAKVDKSHINYAAEDDDTRTSVGSEISENTKESNDIGVIYDEPEDIIMEVRRQNQNEADDAREIIDFEKYLRSSRKQ